MSASKQKDPYINQDNKTNKFFDLSSKKFRLAILVLIMMAYSLIFKSIHASVGNGAFIIMNVFPVAAGLFLGMRAGFVFGLVTPFYVIFLGSTIFLLPDLKAFMPAITVSGVVMVLIGTGVGRLRDLSFIVKKELGKRRQVEAQLRETQNELEERVKTRTMELIENNKELQKEIQERKRAQEEKSKLEAHLLQAEKMEAIGLLAGGVAHDLNNTLSGLTSYPELMLLDLPENDPNREIVTMIKKSGERAVAIVEDLLTLARRGVPTEEVVDLNVVIGEFLTSSEFESLKRQHSNIRVRTQLENVLSNVIGSPVHLTKAIMNLVYNAAEALPEGGDIQISTQNQYIDKPLNGQENMQPDDYVVLSVADAGVGIADDDIGKIFEPFYTKKKMGRSGTGLGMAVIWGTVKDHKGFIDVKSGLKVGTTITIYLPVTRKAMHKGRAKALTENLTGNGESILVVDDMPEQRDVATKILTRLGYEATAVESGEDAIEHLKLHSTDLLLLDMILGTGLDGLDTYKQIQKLHPKQKVIIVSGFAETDRVKALQQLGDAGYIKKPYTLEEIGVAVKGQLGGCAR
jgi:signal transduction histidine kinase/ActR/RegA family two-component response regulator